MSCRRILLLAGILTLIGGGLAWYLPQTFSPIPGLVAEVQACLEPNDAEAAADQAIADPNRHIAIDFAVMGFNTTRAGTTLLASGDDLRIISGVVRNEPTFRAALERLGDARCIEYLARPQVMASSGYTSMTMIGGHVPVLCPADGTVTFTPYGTTIRVTPTDHRDGRIRLHLDVTLSDPSPAFQPGAAAVAEFDEVKLTTGLLVGDGQTCFLGGPTRKRRTAEETRVPLVSDLPGIGGLFCFRCAPSSTRSF
jgi:Flp pilus assembly secretin CpaC